MRFESCRDGFLRLTCATCELQHFRELNEHDIGTSTHNKIPRDSRGWPTSWPSTIRNQPLVASHPIAISHSNSMQLWRAAPQYRLLSPIQDLNRIQSPTYDQHSPSDLCKLGQQEPPNIPLRRKHPSLLKLVSLYQPPEPGKPSRDIIQLPSLIVDFEYTTVLFQFECNVTVDEV